MSEPEFAESAVHGEPLDPKDRVKQREGPSRSGLVTACVLWNGVLVIDLFIFVFVIPSFQVMFKDLGRDLPAPTMFCFDASSFVRSSIGIATAVAFAIAMTLGILRLLPSREWKCLAFYLMTIVAFLLIPFIVVSLFLPLIITVRAIE